MALCSLFVVQNVIVGELGILYIFLTNINIAQVFDYLSGFRNLIGALGLLVVMPIFKRFLKRDFLLFLTFFTRIIKLEDETIAVMVNDTLRALG